MKYSDYSINVGYGYNWVFAKTGFPIFHSYRPLPIKIKIDDTPNTDNHWIKDINFDLITRAAVVYNTNKYFVGASLVMHTYDYRKGISLSLIHSEPFVYMQDSTSGKGKNSAINKNIPEAYKVLPVYHRLIILDSQ